MTSGSPAGGGRRRGGRRDEEMEGPEMRHPRRRGDDQHPSKNRYVRSPEEGEEEESGGEAWGGRHRSQNRNDENRERRGRGCQHRGRGDPSGSENEERARRGGGGRRRSREQWQGGGEDEWSRRDGRRGNDRRGDRRGGNDDGVPRRGGGRERRHSPSSPEPEGGIDGNYYSINDTSYRKTSSRPQARDRYRDESPGEDGGDWGRQGGGRDGPNRRRGDASDAESDGRPASRGPPRDHLPQSHRDGGYRDGGHREGGYRDGGHRDGGYKDRGPPQRYNRSPPPCDDYSPAHNRDGGRRGEGPPPDRDERSGRFRENSGAQQWDGPPDRSQGDRWGGDRDREARDGNRGPSPRNRYREDDGHRDPLEGGRQEYGNRGGGFGRRGGRDDGPNEDWSKRSDGGGRGAGCGRGGDDEFQPREFGGGGGEGRDFGSRDDGGYDRGLADLAEKLREMTFDASDLTVIQKNFYLPHPSIPAITPENAEKIRREKKIRFVRPKDAGMDPQMNPIVAFNLAGFPEPITSLLEERFQAPTAIQQQGWPIALTGKDMIGIAETGSGKTLGFILPGIVHALAQPPIDPGKGPIVLVIAPTRELTLQIAQDTEPFAEACKMRVAALFGQMQTCSNNSDRNLQAGAHIVVACPGKLMDYYRTKRINFLRVTYFVLDEADRLLDMGFKPQIAAIDNGIRRDRQVLMWSATWPPDVQYLARELFKRSDEPPYHIEIGDRTRAIDTVLPDFVECNDYWDKNRKFARHMKATANIMSLVFCATKREVDQLTERLPRDTEETVFPIKIHGGLDQNQRVRNLTEFKQKRKNCLIATDVAARGLDVDNIGQVVIYDLPREYTTYIHQVGRTGRVGRRGRSVAFITQEDLSSKSNVIQELIQGLRKQGHPVPEWMGGGGYSSYNGGGGGGGGGDRRGGGGGCSWGGNGRSGGGDNNSQSRGDENPWGGGNSGRGESGQGRSGAGDAWGDNESQGKQEAKGEGGGSDHWAASAWGEEKEAPKTTSGSEWGTAKESNSAPPSGGESKWGSQVKSKPNHRGTRDAFGENASSWHGDNDAPRGGKSSSPGETVAPRAEKRGDAGWGVDTWGNDGDRHDTPRGKNNNWGGSPWGSEKGDNDESPSRSKESSRRGSQASSTRRESASEMSSRKADSRSNLQTPDQSSGKSTQHSLHKTDVGGGAGGCAVDVNAEDTPFERTPEG